MSDVLKRTTHEKWTSELTDRLFCSHCRWPYDLPVQYNCCGLRQCNECFQQIKKTTCRCPGCSDSNCNVKPDKGFQRDFENLSVNCPKCDDAWVGRCKDLKDHLKRCHCIVECKTCHERFLSVEQLKTHQVYSCTISADACPLCSFGCSDQIQHSELGKHYVDSKHQERILCAVKDIWRWLKASNRQNMVGVQIQRIVAECMPRINAALEQSDLTHQQLLELKSKKKMLETRVQTILKRLQECNNEVVALEKIDPSIKSMIDEIERYITELRKMSVAGPKLIDANDAYIWRVNILFLFGDELCTKNSEVFQTSQWGYRMGLSIAVEIDEPSKDRFISVSFMIFAGEYDQILVWPFSYRVTILLMDVSGGQQHITSTIQPNRTEAIFGKPTNSVNKPFTISRFCSTRALLANSKGYIEDDHAYLKVQIGFAV